MCGKVSRLFKTDVEGSVLSLCEGCSKFGKVMSVIKEPKKEKKQIKEETKLTEQKEEEFILAIVNDYGGIIKSKREKLGIKQEDFAKKISEKMSLIHKIETNHIEPNIDLARKIEKFLHIQLVEQQEIKSGVQEKHKSEAFTIGDFIKIKKK